MAKRKAKKLPEVLSEQEIKALIVHTNNMKGFYGKRMYVFFNLLLCTGLRLNEATSLKYEHINFNTRLLRVVQGKGSKDRNLFVNPQCLEILEEWREYQREVCKEEPVYVFTTMKGGEHKVDNDNFRTKCYEISIEAIGRRIHPHLLRHTFATNFLRNGASIYLVSKCMGHASISTTMIYLHLYDKDVEDAMSKIHF